MGERPLTPYGHPAGAQHGGVGMPGCQERFAECLCQKVNEQQASNPCQHYRFEPLWRAEAGSCFTSPLSMDVEATVQGK